MSPVQYRQKMSQESFRARNRTPHNRTIHNRIGVKSETKARAIRDKTIGIRVYPVTSRKLIGLYLQQQQRRNRRPRAKVNWKIRQRLSNILRRCISLNSYIGLTFYKIFKFSNSINSSGGSRIWRMGWAGGNF